MSLPCRNVEIVPNLLDAQSPCAHLLPKKITEKPFSSLGWSLGLGYTLHISVGCWMQAKSACRGKQPAPTQAPRTPICPASRLSKTETRSRTSRSRYPSNHVTWMKTPSTSPLRSLRALKQFWEKSASVPWKSPTISVKTLVKCLSTKTVQEWLCHLIDCLQTEAVASVFEKTQLPNNCLRLFCKFCRMRGDIIWETKTWRSTK